MTNVDEYDAAMRDMRDIIGKVAIAVGTVLIPKITLLVKAIVSIAAPLWTAYSIMMTPLKQAFTVIFGAIDVVTKLLRGDFRGAWNAVLDTALGVMGNIVYVYNNTLGRIPGIAEIDMERVRKAVESVQAEVKEELTPALEGTTTAMENTTTAAKDLTTATDTLSAAAERQAEKIEAWKEQQEDLRTGMGNLEEATANALPTLDELVSSMEANETAADNTAASVRDLTDDVIDFSEEGSEVLTAAELSQARSYANIQAKADETAAKAEELADRTIAATDRINASWERFVTDQDASVKQMSENNISFGDLVEAQAARNGVSTVEMAQQYATLGVKYGDTLALIEAAGRSTIDATLLQLARLKAGPGARIGSGQYAGGGSTGIGRLTGNAAILAHDALARAGGPNAGFHARAAGPNVAQAQAMSQTLSGTVTLTDGFDDVVGQALVSITERGG